MNVHVYDSAAAVPPSEWWWRHFTAAELACRHCGRVLVVPEALDRLEATRVLYGRPIRIASGYRCPEHPIEAEKPEGPGPHSRGAAFDVYPMNGGDLAEMEDAFFRVGVLGRGKGHMDGSLHLHFDWDAPEWVGPGGLGKRSWGY